ncbi:hypothetical protein D8Y22_20315 [Salinadaptatus halalkaliphilus]|uniref:Acyl-CoA thioesterase n=1 Tax=Salinadaptatus halalkaliphilus TaxID=2419781 RepID=A0A4S3TJP1_9EURY|nr:hypothetical protein D8Y22_20315 [Salinadaptatus halalkaliphilus]
MREIDYEYDRMEADGWQIHTVSASLDYRDGAEFDDELRNRLRLVEIGTSSFTSEHRIERADGSLVAEGTVTHVAVSLESEEPIAVPDDFREAVADYQGGLLE